MSRATKLAEKCGAIVGRGFLDCSVLVFKLTEDELEAFYHAARAEALMEAADLSRAQQANGYGSFDHNDLRAIADREGK